MVRKLLWASLALAPVTILIDRLTGAGDVTLFVLAAISLIPLAWLIGESTEHAAEHTGPGIGGFLNASFGNAPELIVALFAVGANLPDVVRGSLAGSVISNLLLVYGVTHVAGPDGARIDRRSLLVQLGLVGAAVVAVPACRPRSGYTGPPERHEVVVASVPVAILLALYLASSSACNLRRHQRRASEPSRRKNLVAAPPPSSRCRRDRRDGLGERDPRPLAGELCDGRRPERLLRRRRDRGDRRQRRRARRGDRHRAEREDAARDRDRDLVQRAGGVARRPGRDAPLPVLHAPPCPRVSLVGAFGDGRRGPRAAATVWDGTSSRREGLLLVAVYTAAVVGFFFAGGR